MSAPEARQEGTWFRISEAANGLLSLLAVLTVVACTAACFLSQPWRMFPNAAWVSIGLWVLLVFGWTETREYTAFRRLEGEPLKEELRCLRGISILGLFVSWVFMFVVFLFSMPD